MRENWCMWSGAMASDEISKITSLIGDLEDASTVSGHENKRNSKVFWLTEHEWIRDQLFKYVNLANGGYFRTNVWNAAEIQYTEYHAETGGFYDWHSDVDWESDNHWDRKLSVTVQLSDTDDYEGGNFKFDGVSDLDQNEARKLGTVLVFPSHLRHCVEPVTSGVRKSLVAWFDGPRWT